LQIAGRAQKADTWQNFLWPVMTR